jgi:hypothetical protein
MLLHKWGDAGLLNLPLNVIGDERKVMMMMNIVNDEKIMKMLVTTVRKLKNNLVVCLF